MRLILTLMIFVPMAVVIGIFAVENRQPLALELWPLSGVYQMWASVWVLGLLGAGILLGLAIGWLGGTGWRRRARRARRPRARSPPRERSRKESRANRNPARAGYFYAAPRFN